MSERSKNIPVPEPDENEPEYICPAASWSDMTGLIPSRLYTDAPTDGNYEEIYPFLPDANGALENPIDRV